MRISNIREEYNAIEEGSCLSKDKHGRGFRDKSITANEFI